MNEKELDFVLMELETENLEEEVYRYRTPWGLSVVYYMIDFRLVFQGIFEPIYLSKDDVKELDYEENTLFDRILKNTMLIMSVECMKFSGYLKELKKDCTQTIDVRLIDGITNVMDLQDKKSQLWCITSGIRDRGAVGAFSTPLLQKICKQMQTDKILVGVERNDYALIYQDTQDNQQALKGFTYRIGNIREFSPEIVQRNILVYDGTKNILETWTGNS